MNAVIKRKMFWTKNQETHHGTRKTGYQNKKLKNWEHNDEIIPVVVR